MLAERLNLSASEAEVISFVGGGGKTSSIFKLAHEFKTQNKKVLVAPTTKIFFPRKEDFDQIIITGNKSTGIFSAEPGSVTVLGQEVGPQNKISGVEADFIEQIFAAGLFDCILVEADGAKQKSIKTPAIHEPVIPVCTTKTVGMIGLSCLGQTIENVAFRSELFAKLTKSKLSDLIDVPKIYKLIVDEEGLLKNAPGSSEKHLFLNQVEDEKTKEAAFELIYMLLENKFKLDSFIIGSLKDNVFFFPPYRRNIAGIIMASGFSRRMGQDKLLLKLSDGMPLVEKVIKAASESDLNEIILVYREPKVEKIGKKYGIKTVYNQHAADGQSAAVKLGVEMAEKFADGYMFLAGDQPFINAQLINKLLCIFKNTTYPILVPLYDGIMGTPTVFTSGFRNELLKITGDEGARSIIRNNPQEVKKVNIPESFRGIDIDTPEQLNFWFRHDLNF